MDYLVVNKSSSISLLQQRLNYIDQYPEREYTVLLENVPKWPENTLPSPSISAQMVASYENSQGSSQLRTAVCQREAEHYDLTVMPEQVLITNGAFHGISLITRYLEHSGGVALCQTPVLDSVHKLLKSAHYQIEELKVESGQVDLTRLAHQCSEGVRLIYLNLPHNPSGDMLDKQELTGLLDVARQYGVVVLVDLVYDSFLFGDSEAVNPLLLTQDWDNVFVINSMSKGYGVPGIRVGWMVTAEKHIENMTSQLEAECISVCTASQQYACELLAQGNAELVDRVTKHWGLAGELLNQLDGAHFSIPVGGTQYFVEVPVNDIEAFADFMLVEFGLVLVTSGNYIGESRACLRFPIGHPQATLEKGLLLLQQGLLAWSELS